MEKPLVRPVWASDETNNAEPSAPQKASGWTPGQDGVSSYDNWYKNHGANWFEFLDEMFVGGEEKPTFVEAIEAPKIHYSEPERVAIPAALARPENGHTATFVSPVWSLGTSTAKLVYPIPNLRQGDQISAWGVFFQKNSGAGVGSVNAFLQQVSNITGAVTTIGAIQTDSSTGVVLLSADTFTYDPDIWLSSNFYQLVVYTAGQANDVARGAYVDISHPRP